MPVSAVKPQHLDSDTVSSALFFFPSCSLPHIPKEKVMGKQADSC